MFGDQQRQQQQQFDQEAAADLEGFLSLGLGANIDNNHTNIDDREDNQRPESSAPSGQRQRTVSRRVTTTTTTNQSTTIKKSIKTTTTTRIAYRKCAEPETSNSNCKKETEPEITEEDSVEEVDNVDNNRLVKEIFSIWEFMKLIFAL